MLKTNAILEHKVSDQIPSECFIEKIITLSGSEYDSFSHNLLRDYDFIKENADLMHIDQDGAYHCLLILGDDMPDGILVESEGYNYARSSSLIPHAADWLKTQELEQTVARMSEMLDTATDTALDRLEGQAQYDMLHYGFGMTHAELEAMGLGLNDTQQDIEPEAGPQMNV